MITTEYSIAQFSVQPGWPCSPDIELTNGAPSSIYLKILLIEFSDIKHKQNNPYTFQNFTDLFFSINEYVSPNKYSPDGEQVFGSVRDYYKIMSNNNLTITGSILNRALPNNSNLPEWLVLDNTKSFYNSSQTNGVATFEIDVKAKAQQLGYDISTNENTFLVIIYAGDCYRYSGYLLVPHAVGTDTYINSERFESGAPYDDESPTATFVHIGSHAHELGHLLGLDDAYSSGNDYLSSETGYWDLMAAGNFCGPTYKGECPAPINPIDRAVKGWISISTVTINSSQTLTYNLSNPLVYKINNSSTTNDEYYLEMRSFNKMMQLGNFYTNDYNCFLPKGLHDKGILVWQKSTHTYEVLPGVIVPVSNAITLLHASGQTWPAGGFKGSDGDIFPGTFQKFMLTPDSDSRTKSDFNSVDQQYQYYVPNSKPSSNVGFEITGIGSESYNVNLYYNNPPLYNPKSISTNATAGNNQRKIIIDTNGYIHVVYSSNGEIFYHKKVNGIWQNLVKVSFENGSNDYPSIAMGTTGPIVVWQRNIGTNTYNIYCAVSIDGGTTWPTTSAYIIQSSVSSSFSPTPGIAMNSNGRKTIVFSDSDGLKSRTTTVTNPTSQNDWSALQNVVSSSIIKNPSITHDGSYFIVAYQNTSDNQAYYTWQNYDGTWQSYENISSIVPGSAVNQNPSISAVPAGGELHVAWSRVTNSGSSSSDFKIIHRKKGNAYYSWPNEYFATYYEAQQLPSISALSTNKVDLLFQTIPSYGNSVYKMRYNGSYWNAPSLVSSNSVNPTVSTGSTTSKYVSTNGTNAPYTIMLSNETLSKETEFNSDVYSRSIAIMNNPNEYLEIILNKVYLVMEDGSTQKVNFLTAELEELKNSENFELTPKNALDILRTNKNITIPVNANEMIVEFKIKGENVDKLIDGKQNMIDLLTFLESPAKHVKLEKLNSFQILNGNIVETKIREKINLNELKIEKGFDKVTLGLNFKNVFLKNECYASLGHIYDYRVLDVSESIKMNKTSESTRGDFIGNSMQNYPNPFNPTTKIYFTLKEKGRVSLKIFDVLGIEINELISGYHEAGEYEIPFDGSNLPSGIYFYRITTPTTTITKKMMLIK